MGWGERGEGRESERESDAFLQNANGPNVIDDGSSDDICLLLQHISGHFREPRGRVGRVFLPLGALYRLIRRDNLVMYLPTRARATSWRCCLPSP